jgi:hypothetical protein
MNQYEMVASCDASRPFHPDHVSRPFSRGWFGRLSFVASGAPHAAQNAS